MNADAVNRRDLRRNDLVCLFILHNGSIRDPCCSFFYCRSNHIWQYGCWRGFNVQSLSARISGGRHRDSLRRALYPSAWAAAIQTALREKFGGVRQGNKASYALVEGSNKKAIVKINDIGPLKPGRVIDFNEQTMRYFDPTLSLGVIQNVKVTPLPGDDWTPGPVAQR